MNKELGKVRSKNEAMMKKETRRERFGKDDKDRCWVGVRKKREVRMWKKGDLGNEGRGGDRSCIMKCWANLENSSWLKPEGLSFQNI